LAELKQLLELQIHGLQPVLKMDKKMLPSGSHRRDGDAARIMQSSK
jgi:hypothetical protein